MTDFLEQKRSEIDKRLSELKPLVEEYHRLEAAAAALQQVNGGKSLNGGPSGATRARTTAAAPKRAAAKRSTARGTASRPGRRKGSGTRTVQTLELVEAAATGITIPEIAAKMGIKQNYLYRVLPALQKEGKVRKRGKAWLPKAAA